MEEQNTTTQKKKKQAQDPKVYIREWKRAKYAEDGDSIKAMNKAYYYKNKCGLSSEDIKTYGMLLPFVAKIKIAVDEFRQRDLQKSVHYLETILNELKTPQPL